MKLGRNEEFDILTLSKVFIGQKLPYIFGGKGYPNAQWAILRSEIFKTIFFLKEWRYVKTDVIYVLRT